MLIHHLTHPPRLAALAAAGHGSPVLIADSTHPRAKAYGPNAQVIRINLSRGLAKGPDVLRAFRNMIKVESAAVTAPGINLLAIHEEYAQLQGVDVPLENMERLAFYEAARGQDLGVLVASGEDRNDANPLLTVDVAPSI